MKHCQAFLPRCILLVSSTTVFCFSFLVLFFFWGGGAKKTKQKKTLIIYLKNIYIYIQYFLRTKNLMFWKGSRTRIHVHVKHKINVLSMHCRRNKKLDYLHQHMNHTC